MLFLSSEIVGKTTLSGLKQYQNIYMMPWHQRFIHRPQHHAWKNSIIDRPHCMGLYYYVISQPPSKLKRNISYFIYSFDVKYLGCMEVFESRGMTVCEEALKKLKSSKKKSVKAILYINGDGLRVVDYETKGLLLDQTIEKVSFCAPDHNYERGFSYICRDGTTRRWICHGFMAVKETVSILSATPTTPSFVSLPIKIMINQKCRPSVLNLEQEISFLRIVKCMRLNF